MYARRKRVNKVALLLSLAAMAFGVFWLIWILWETVRLGFAGLTWETLSQMTPPPNEPGGLLNAIWGSLLMVVLATFVGTPPGAARARWCASAVAVGRRMSALSSAAPIVGACTVLASR